MHHTTAGRRTLAAAAALLAAACQDPAGSHSQRGPSEEGALARQPLLDAAASNTRQAGRPIPDQYIVVLKDDGGDARRSTEAVLQRFAGDRVQPTHVYESAVRGFAARIPAKVAEKLRADPAVAYVEQDQEVDLAQVTQSGATWGIDRIDQRSRPLSGTYTYTRTGAGVSVYIIDTGINNTHTDFGSRASNVYNGVGGQASDCNGHGTHVAGTVGGARWGVAKGARLLGVKVFSCSGGSATSTIIAGIDWVRRNHVKPAVANLSLGGGFSQASNDAVTNLANAGVYTVVAAGNSNANACNFSPASAPAVMTVASSTSSDAKSSFSNFGSCVDVYAPGSSITAPWIGSTTATNTISGTSMASPHVAGVAALYKSAFGDAAQSTINTWIVNNSTTGVITGNPSGTPNRLAFKSTL